MATAARGFASSIPELNPTGSETRHTTCDISFNGKADDFRKRIVSLVTILPTL